MRKFIMRNTDKKGVSLAYVVMAAAALLILSGALVASASRNIDLTDNSTDGRQTYMSVKSAVEYAKGVVNQECIAAQTEFDGGGTPVFNDFYVKPGTGTELYSSSTGTSTLDGKNCYATCKIEQDASNSKKYNITIKAKSQYARDNARVKTMNYTISYDLNSGGSIAGFQYILYGAKYGKHAYITTDINTPTISENTNGQGVSDYPVVFNLPVKSSSGSQSRILQAPQIFFMGETFPSANSGDLKNSAIYTSNQGTANIKSNFIYVASDKIIFKANMSDKSNYSLKISPINSGETAYIYFANTSGCKVLWTKEDNLNASNAEVGTVNSFSQGLYSYDSEKDLFYPCSLSEVTSGVDDILKDNNVDYVKSRNMHLTSSEEDDAPTSPYPNGKGDCTLNGVIKGSIGTGYEDNDVYMYVDGKNSDPTSKWTDGGKYIYPANQISLLYVTHDDTKDPVIRIGAEDSSNTGVAFTANTVALSGQKQDGAGTNTDSLTLSQVGTGEFILYSANGTDPVNVILYHKLVVKKSDGSYYSVSAGTYTVPNGTNLFTTTTKDSDFTKVDESGTPIDDSGGGSGGFSGGEYS